MATSKEVEKELAIALREVGKIEPWFDKELNDWVFSHKLYPVECGGLTSEEVVKNYPRYLKEFIKQRLDNNLDPLVEKKTKGHGGYRPGAGRPKGTSKGPKRRVYVPEAVAEWLKDREHLLLVTKLMRKYC